MPVLPATLDRILEDLGFVTARLDDADLHARRGQFLRQRNAEGLKGVLAHLISPSVSLVENSTDRADVDDSATVSNDQRCEGLGHAIWTIGIHLHHEIEFLGLCVDQGSDRENTGIVDEAIQAAPGLRHCLNGGVNVLGLGHV